MRVSIVGAGPAGLYLGVLLAKADPSHEIRVLERNPPDATFGWGVVFSEETLGALRDADLQTHVEITDTFVRWDTVDVRCVGGPRLRSRGHSFSAIARKQLLTILQRRCTELGVKLEFGMEVDEASRPVPGDLVVAADGVNSLLRQGRATELGSIVRPQGGKYVWFGTDLVLDAFTFIFRSAPHGLFQVHAYPFDERTSTFIVECPEPTWRRAGLDQMTESESIAFCEALFAEDLDGHRLLSNRSMWLDFLRVSNRSWHHRNVVLIGDAAHTAHFSIGSGTKLAMEDAIALANAFVRHDDIGAAIVDYELERQPIVERAQQAADDSVAYFERAGDHTPLEPLQFAFNLLTRSGRISHANLEVRDPEFVRALDSWFDGAAQDHATPPRSLAPPPAFAPLSVGGLTMPNRIVRTPSPARHDDLGALARSGAGLVLTGLVAVTAEGRTSVGCPTLGDDDDARRWPPLVDQAHSAGALVMLRLGHAGRRGATQIAERGIDLPLRAGAWPLLSASDLAYGPTSDRPEAMDRQDMAAIRAAFAAAAGRAATAGFDAVELDMAHGYLLASFLSPLANRRDDDYGGSLANRLRFPLEVLQDVREVWPDDRLLAVRLSLTDWASRGLGVDQGIEIARELVARGAQLVHVEAGQTVAEARPEYRRGFLTALSDRVRSEVGVPTLVGGYLTTADEVHTIVGAGRADLCLVDLPEPDGDPDAERAVDPRPSAGAHVSSPFFADWTSPQAEQLHSSDPPTVLLLPVGATEPHGPHAPLSTDSLISLSMCRRAVERLADDPELRALILPTLPYGVTRYAAAFAGAIHVEADTLHALVTDVCVSLVDQGLRHVVMVNNHFEPGQVATLRRVVETVREARGVEIGYLDLVRRHNAERLTDEFQAGECHAGRYETSLVLADHPELVDQARRPALPRVAVDMPAAISEGRHDFVAMGMHDAYCGAPAEATAQEGEATLTTLTDMLVEVARDVVRGSSGQGQGSGA